MAYIHLKFKHRKVAEKVLNEVTDKYQEEILAFDIENLTKEIYPSSDAIFGLREISKRGGSLSITIPKEIANYMNLEEGDTLLFMVRKRVGRVYIQKVKKVILRE